MLTSLRIKNLALVESAHLSFGPGLTVLTGESGSGKSVILDALALVSGAARPRLKARAGCRSGLAEAEFLPPRKSNGSLKDPTLTALLDTHGLLSACEDPDEAIVLARRVESSGRTRCFIQGQTVSRAILATIGDELLELCGQSEAHRLRTPKAQLLALDQFGDLSAERRALEKHVKRLRARKLASEEAHRLSTEAERRRDFLEFQLKELNECNLIHLAEERARLLFLEGATARTRASQESLHCLKNGDHAVLAQLKWLLCRLSALENGEKHESPHAGSADNLLETISSSIDSLEDVCSLSEQVAKEGEEQEEEREELRSHMQSVDALAQKHRLSAEELPARRLQLKEELALAEEHEQDHKKLKHELSLLQEQATNLADALHEKRRKAAARLEKRLKHELASVGLSGARLETHLSRGELGPTGITHLDIGFSANPGHPPQPLARVASGGELSRILLCFRLATDTSAQLLTFDEIDSGAGGKTAEQIAQALLRAADKGQVLCVSHWPQVAGVAQHQFAVSKCLKSNSAHTLIQAVSGETRLAEISRMLGGTEPTARLHASMLVRSTTAAA